MKAKTAIPAIGLPIVLWLCAAQLLPGQAASSATPGSAVEPVVSAQGPASGAISGVVVDSSGALASGARVQLIREDASQNRDTATGEDGRFHLLKLSPGPFQLKVSAPGFTTETISGVLHPGEAYEVPKLALSVASTSSVVQVHSSTTELAAEQIQLEERQRLLGIIPNFYVAYDPNTVAMTRKQKFQMSFRFVIDPTAYAITGIIAGVQQANNNFSGYGPGAEGYGKRYGAAYGNFLISNLMSDAILPSLFKQDPRYFYKGSGTKKSRVLYALKNAVIRKGDNGHWQPDYSHILGDLAAGGISNLYYPAADRNGAALTFENAAIGVGAHAAANLLQEFEFPRLTRHAKGRQAKP